MVNDVVVRPPTASLLLVCSSAPPLPRPIWWFCGDIDCFGRRSEPLSRCTTRTFTDSYVSPTGDPA